MGEDAIIIYTDGASRGNPGRGGYGVILKYKDKYKEFSYGYMKTTNNRMELLAVIVGLEAIKKRDLPVVVYSDSSYVVDAIEKKWLLGWVKKGFVGKKNEDLWRRYLKAAQGLNIKFIWVKGHSTNAGNNRCDQLATQAADSSELGIDRVYEESI